MLCDPIRGSRGEHGKAGPGTVRLDPLPAESAHRLLRFQVKPARWAGALMRPQKHLWQCPALPCTLPGLHSLLGQRRRQGSRQRG